MVFYCMRCKNCICENAEYYYSIQSLEHLSDQIGEPLLVNAIKIFRVIKIAYFSLLKLWV